MRLRLLAVFAVPVAAAALALGIFSACSNQGEGQPCSVKNGNNDCNDGLQCEVPLNPNASNAPSVCCPPSGGTTPECSLQGNRSDASPAPPDAPVESSSGDAGDAGDAADGSSDGAGDATDGASSEAGDGAADGTSDAPADGSGDGKALRDGPLKG